MTDTRTELLRAELAELDAAAEFAAVKESEARRSDAWVAASDALNAARNTYRTLRDNEGA